MAEVFLNPLASSSYQTWRKNLIEGYAASNVTAKRWQADDAQQLATESTDSLLPRGIKTPDHFIWTISTIDAAEIGTLWLHIQREAKVTGWIYDIQLNPIYRGKGYGRAAMLAVEEEAKKYGATAIGLHVFKFNKVAYSLYKSIGYVQIEASETGLVMEKIL